MNFDLRNIFVLWELTQISDLVAVPLAIGRRSNIHDDVERTRARGTKGKGPGGPASHRDHAGGVSSSGGGWR